MKRTTPGNNGEKAIRIFFKKTTKSTLFSPLSFVKRIVFLTSIKRSFLKLVLSSYATEKVRLIQLKWFICTSNTWFFNLKWYFCTTQYVQLTYNGLSLHVNFLIFLFSISFAKSLFINIKKVANFCRRKICGKEKKIARWRTSFVQFSCSS